jgi:predicted peroxiredoxin
METKKKLVILISRGFDDERASVAWSIANGGIKTGLDVSIFLTSSAVDWVRKGAADSAHINPFDPTMKEMIQFVIDSECTIMVCPPCLKARNIPETELIKGVVVTGSGAMHEIIKQGAAALSF